MDRISIIVKKDKFLVIFYILYFSWLFTITILGSNSIYNNLFSLVVVLFYFIFLKENLDEIIFLLSLAFPFLLNTNFYHEFFSKPYEYSLLTPFWLPVMWGTTVLALRKLLIILLHKSSTAS